MALLFFLLIALPIAASQKLFPHGKENGDTVIIDSQKQINRLSYGDTDNGIKVIDTPNFPFYQRKTNNNKIQLSTNGYIVFGSNKIFNSATPTNFPINYQGHTLPIIAAFWTDFYFQLNSIFSYQIHTYGEALHRVQSLVAKNHAEEIFIPKHVLVVTWFNVHHKSKLLTDSFAFQLVIATDGKTTHVIFLHDSVPKNVPASVGFQEKLNIQRFDHSLETGVGNYLLQSSNVDINGIYEYKVAEEALDCSNLPDGPNPHPSDCQKYIICHNHVLVEVKQCNHSDHFHPEYKFCVPASEYPCHQVEPADCSGKHDVTLPHNTDCSKMVFCQSGKIKKVTSCPNGLNFHPTLKVCVWPSQYPCEKGGNGEVPANPCDGRSDGNYEDPKSCNHFIQCAHGLHHRMMCPAGLHFNQAGPPGTLGFCDWPFNVGCTRSS